MGIGRDVTFAQALSDLAEADSIARDFVPVLTTLSKDTVPNVRLNVARTIERLTPRADQYAMFQIPRYNFRQTAFKNI